MCTKLKVFELNSWCFNITIKLNSNCTFLYNLTQSIWKNHETILRTLQKSAATIRRTRYSIYAIPLNLTASCVFCKYFNSLKFCMLFLNFFNVLNAFWIKSVKLCGDIFHYRTGSVNYFSKGIRYTRKVEICYCTRSSDHSDDSVYWERCAQQAW